MKIIIQILLPIILLLSAFLGAKALIKNNSPIQNQKPHLPVPKINTVTLSPLDHRPSVHSFGTITTRDEARIMPELTARVIWIDDNFRVGEQVRKDQLLIALEPSNFETALEEQKANLSDLKRQLAEEKVRANRAKADWTSSGRKLEDASELRLRLPQLTALTARLKSTEAAISTASLNLQRTKILAPFAGRVLTRNVTLGEIALPQDTLGTLASVDLAEIRLPLSPEQIARVTGDISPESLAQKSLPIRLTTPDNDGFRPAAIVRIDPTTDARNQVRYFIAEISHPFEQNPFSLSIGMFVNAEIDGQILPKSLRIPESALVDDDYLWVVDNQNLLRKLEVFRLASQQDDLIVEAKTPLTGPATIVTRPLTTFRPGMTVSPSSKSDQP